VKRLRCPLNLPSLRYADIVGKNQTRKFRPKWTKHTVSFSKVYSQTSRIKLYTRTTPLLTGKKAPEKNTVILEKTPKKCYNITGMGGLSHQTTKGKIMADIIQTQLFNYFAQRHFDLMPAAVRDRFDDYAETGGFVGHMKTWNEKLVGGTPPELKTELNDQQWYDLYDAFQETFQKMDINRVSTINNIGFHSDYNAATKDFISKWFGDSSKTFTISKVKTDNLDPEDPNSPKPKEVLDELAAFLKDPHTIDASGNPVSGGKEALKSFLTKTLKDIFTEEYDTFINGIETGRYDKDLEFREKVNSLIRYIQNNGPKKDGSVPASSQWPAGVGYRKNAEKGIMASVEEVVPFLEKLDLAGDTENWYQTPRDPYIDWFKEDYVNIFDEILTNEKIRGYFLAKAPSLIREAIEEAIKATDYENKDSKDFVQPKLTDEKNWRQQLKKWGKETWDNHFRRFTNPSRGTRIFFSPYSQTIMKAFDKVEIKPSDGLDGILNKKSDSKLLNVLAERVTAKEHFDWFTKTLETLKAEIPDAFEGALRNGKQMRKLVSALIVRAEKDNKVDEAKTALEILSVAKYGLSTSRTVDALRKMDVNLFSDSKYSWMKDKNIAPMARIADRLAKDFIIGIGAAGAATYNFIQHRRTKIKSDISKDKDLNEAYNVWLKKDKRAREAQGKANAPHNINAVLTALNNSGRAATLPIGGAAEVTFKTNFVLNADNIDDAKEMVKQWKAGNAPATIPTTPAGTPATAADLDNDIKIFEDYYKRVDNDDKIWRKNHPDTIHDLIAYWDMLESFGKTHTFRLGSMKTKRKAMLENWNDKKSRAQAISKAYIKGFTELQYKEI